MSIDYSAFGVTNRNAELLAKVCIASAEMFHNIISAIFIHYNMQHLRNKHLKANSPTQLLFQCASM